MTYQIIKALHIIFMVSYFAGLFYLVRLFVYYKDTDAFETEKKKILREQYVFMMTRLWNIITLPAFVLMSVFGITMIIMNMGLMSAGWFHLKMLFLIGLFFYHYWSWKKIKTIKNLQGGDLQDSNVGLRQFNEVATFLLFLVVFTVILKSQIITYGWQLLCGFIVLVVVITLIVKLVNKNKK